MRSGYLTRSLAAMCLAAAFAAGCGAPEDETLLRFLGFQAAGNSGTGSVSVIEGELRDGAALKADAAFENHANFLGAAGGGSGIVIYRVEIDYGLGGSDPPSFSYPVSLYAPPVAVGSKDAGGEKVVLSDIPIVPASVKQWLIDHHAAGGDGVVEMTAKVDFLARTDEGDELRVGGALAVTLTDAGGGGGTPTEPVLTIEATVPAAIDSAPTTNGQFRVYRNGDTTGALSVTYGVSGSATEGATADSGADYRTLSRTLTIASGSSSNTIDVVPWPDATAESDKTVTVTVFDGAGYSVGEPNSATVTISDN